MHHTPSLVRPRDWGILVCLTALALISLACVSQPPQVFVPHQPTAELQYLYANNYRTSKNIVLRDRSDSVRWSRSRKALEKAYEKVIELFPEDLEYTPLAKLEIAEIRGGLDFSAAKRTPPRELRQAIRMFQDLQKEYPQNDYVHAKSMLDEALVWKELREFDKVQTLLVELIELYGESPKPEILLILMKARSNYQQIYVD